MKEIEKLALAGKFTKADIKGKVTKRTGVLEDQIKHDFKYGDIKKIKPLKVVIDPGNGMGAQYLEAMFKKLPCKVTKLYFELDGSFPNHTSNPFHDENNKDIQDTIKKEKADLGIATDGDGDRVFFIDDKGITIDPAIIRGILAQIFLKDYPKSHIGYDIRPGKITKDMILEAGGKPFMTRVGHAYIKDAMRKHNAIFSGESSGHFFLKYDKGAFECPIVLILKLLEEFSQSEKTVSEYIKPLQKYFHSGEINYTVEDKDGKMKQLASFYKDIAKDTSWIDGVTIDTEKFWFNVRPSNTEPLLRLNLEAVSKEEMEKRRDEVEKIITH
jgi:phosphomannomutase